MIVAIDGPVGSGKSSAGRRLAAELQLPFVDSGLMYRALAWLALAEGFEPSQAAELSELAARVRIKIDRERVWANGQELTTNIYSPEINRILSPLAQVAGVRSALVVQQRELVGQGVVMAGRDIGTVVFPNADFKFFLTATLEERVRRRALQYEKRGEEADQAAMKREVAERDRLDSERSVAPLRAAEDAVVIQTDGMPLEEVVQFMLQVIRTARR